MPNPSLLRVCATVGLVGAIFPVFADVISWFLAQDYSPFANSISKLAVGPSSWLIDLGLWAFVLSCLAVAVGLWSWRLDARFWTAALACLILLGVAVGIIARVNDYYGTENPGANVHAWATYSIGVLFPLTALLAIPGLRTRSERLARFSLWLGLAWIVLAIYYFWFVPNGWSGAVERLLAAMMLAWLGTMSGRLHETARRARQGQPAAAVRRG